MGSPLSTGTTAYFVRSFAQEYLGYSSFPSTILIDAL